MNSTTLSDLMLVGHSLIVCFRFSTKLPFLLMFRVIFFFLRFLTTFLVLSNTMASLGRQLLKSDVAAFLAATKPVFVNNTWRKPALNARIVAQLQNAMRNRRASRFDEFPGSPRRNVANARPEQQAKQAAPDAGRLVSPLPVPGDIPWRVWCS